jgi:hypothetical protein
MYQFTDPSDRRWQPRLHPPEERLTIRRFSGDSIPSLLKDISSVGANIEVDLQAPIQLGEQIRVDYPGRSGQSRIYQVVRMEPSHGPGMILGCHLKNGPRARPRQAGVAKIPMTMRHAA